MGALQLALGPDQRVSAAANLLETTVEQRPQVLGVWATADAPDLDQSEGDLIAWLVSDAQASEEVPTVNGLVNLVSAGGIQSDGTEMRDAVWVAKTPVFLFDLRPLLWLSVVSSRPWCWEKARHRFCSSS